MHPSVCSAMVCMAASERTVGMVTQQQKQQQWPTHRVSREDSTFPLPIAPVVADAALFSDFRAITVEDGSLNQQQ